MNSMDKDVETWEAEQETSTQVKKFDFSSIENKIKHNYLGCSD